MIPVLQVARCAGPHLITQEVINNKFTHLLRITSDYLRMTLAIDVVFQLALTLMSEFGPSRLPFQLFLAAVRVLAASQLQA